MSLNKFMHPRNPFFNKPPDFFQLSQKYPEFSRFCLPTKNEKSATVDFKNPESLRAVCGVLLRDLFNLDVELPLNHLIPRVPQRINYTLWIEDLLGQPEKAVGIDIGCGASCIYGLIICSMNKNWKMIVSDLDPESIEWAQKNVDKNGLSERISVNKVSNQDSILIDLLKRVDSEFLSIVNGPIDFVMCNPPFFRSESEFTCTSGKIRNPEKRPATRSANPAKLTECVFEEHGEIGFVKRIVDESIILKDRIKIYTSMLGKKESLGEIKKYLREKHISNVTESQFCQGHTMRWAVAWSFDVSKIPQVTFFKPKKEEKNCRSKPLVYEIPVESIEKDDNKIECAFETIKKIFIDQLKFKIIDCDSNFKCRFEVSEKTWLNQRAKRRRQLRETQTETSKNDQIEENEKIKLEFELNLRKNLQVIAAELSLCGNESTSSGDREHLNQILQFLKNKISQNIDSKC